MNEDLDDIQYWPIRDYQYAHWFETVQYNGKTLSESERKEFVAVIDDTIAILSKGLPLMHESLESTRDHHDIFHEMEKTFTSVMLFVLMTMIDSLVASKYFILADKDYDRRYMRGKLYVILNEGFKKLYGFTPEARKKSDWGRLLPWMERFPKSIIDQYQEVSAHLEEYALSSWWKDERNLEVHMMDVEKLYCLRQEEIIESKVMMDSMKLYNTLFAVNEFLSNAHGCIVNALIKMYRRGELKE